MRQKEESMRYNPGFHDSRNIVVPLTTTWDKLAALCLHVLVVRGTTFDGVTIRFEDEFCDDNGHPSIAAIPPTFYDIDVRLRYNQSPITGYMCKPGKKDRQKCGYSTSTKKHTELESRACPRCDKKLVPIREYGSAVHYEAMINDVGTVPGVGQLVHLMNGNNATGYLKERFSRSLVRLIRKMFEVGHNVTFLEHRRRVLGMFIPVMQTYFDVAQRDLAALEALPNPFMVDGYGDMLSLLGHDRPEILEILEPIKRALSQVQVRLQQAAARARDASVRRFEISSLHGQAAEMHLLDSDDHEIAGPYFQAHGGVNNPALGVLVIHGSDGNYAILTKGLWDLNGLAVVLQQVEPGRWHHEGRYESPMLLNGGQSRASVPSELKPMSLITLIQHHAVPPLHVQEHAGRRERYREERESETSRS